MIRISTRRMTAAAHAKAKPRQKRAGNDCAQHADNDIAQKAKAEPLDQQARKPAGNGADDEKDEKAADAHNVSVKFPQRPCAGIDTRAGAEPCQCAKPAERTLREACRVRDGLDGG